MMIDLKLIVSIIIAIFASSGFWQFIIYKQNRNDNKSKAVLALLHDKLYYLCEKYLKLGYITVEDFENINYLYEPYINMGGNGTITILYDKIKKLPQKETKIKEN